MLKKIYSLINLNSLSHSFLILSFTFVFYFSFSTVLHHHSFSQIFISYSEGFVKNALLGEFVFSLKKITNLDFKILINSIFVIFHLLNILLFLRILKPVINYSKIIYIFLVLNPALILFPIYDIGAFLRKEIFMVSSFLVHIYFSQLLNFEKIDKKKYGNLVSYILGPFILINSLIHSIQILFLPLHFFIYKRNLNSKYERKNILFIFLLIILFLMQFFFYKQISYNILYESTLERLGIFTNQFNFSITPYIFLNLNIAERFDATLPYIKNTKFVFLYFISILIIVMPLIFMLKKLETLNQKFEIKYILFSILPFIMLLFLASDWGRWIYIIAMILVGTKLQFKINNKVKFEYGLLINLLLFLTIGFYLFFFNLSHCCVKNLFFYGMNQNIELFINVLFDNLKVIEHIKY